MAREVQRSVLPIPDQPSFGLVTYDARDPDTKFPPIEPLRAPPGAPSVVVFPADETTDIGEDFGMPVSSDYPGDTSKFNGKIDLVQIDLGDDNHDHLIDPGELIRIAMARQ